jgi:hypothetical protein
MGKNFGVEKAVWWLGLEAGADAATDMGHPMKISWLSMFSE